MGVVLKIILVLFAFYLSPAIGIVTLLCVVIPSAIESSRQSKEIQRQRNLQEEFKRIEEEGHQEFLRRQAEREQAYLLQQQQKHDALVPKYEDMLTDAITDIEHFEPKYREICSSIDKIKAEEDLRTAHGHYLNTDAKVQKELSKLEDKKYTISKKLERAERNRDKANAFLNGEVI